MLRENMFHKIVIAGDLFPSSGNITLFEHGDARTLFSPEVCQLFSEADFSIANLEGALTDSEEKTNKADGPSIKAPPKTIVGIKELGLKAVSLANNHITDYGNQGYQDTIDSLNSSGIRYVGAGNSISNIKTHLSIDLDTLKICIYNVSELFFNKPDENTAGVNLYDEWIVLNEIKRLKETHDYLIVIYHGGAEYLQYPTPNTRKRFHRMAECGADFITAQHTHCIGCEEWYKGSYLLYGQGNFLYAGQKKFVHLTKQGLVSEIVLSGNDFKVKHHLVNIAGNVLQYDANQDFSSFKERSARINDEKSILEEYKNIKVRDILLRQLAASKGLYPLRRVLSKLFPKQMVKYVAKSFLRQHVLLNLYAVRSDRVREDVLAIWEYVLANTKNQ